MKSLPIFISCVLAMQTLADDAKTNAAQEPTAVASPVAAEKQTAAITVPFSSAMITVPFVSTNGIISQPDQTELDGGGKAIFNFTIGADGDYLIRAVVNATDESANSFFLNIDAQPEDPTMIWDIEPTSGYEERTVNWRGNGSPEEDEFSPKRFKLKTGDHKLFIIGREPETQLKSISILPAKDTK